MNYDDNLARVLTEDNATAIRNEHGGIEAIRFANGTACAWRCPGDSDSRETHSGAKLVRTVAKAHNDIARVQADSTRSESWKAEQIGRITDDAALAFAVVKAEANKVVADFDAADARDAVPPAIQPGDYATALVDHECREWLRSLDRDAQVKLIGELTEPRHTRLLAAMMRSPVPLPVWIAPAVSGAWLDVQAKADPHGARLRRQASERVNWLRQVMEQSANTLPKSPSKAPTVQSVP
jgi:hypothetical protein